MAKPATPPPEAAAADGAAPAKAASPWPALIAAIILMPAISYATAEFLLLPKLRGLIAKSTTEGGDHAEPADAHGAHGGHGKGKEGAKGEASYDFDSVVVNLSGSMGTRFLKASFTTLGSNPKLPEIMAEKKKQLLDVAINVLSSRSMADLEAPGAKNVVRNELMANFNQALKSDLVEQIYFTDFVIQ